MAAPSGAGPLVYSRQVNALYQSTPGSGRGARGRSRPAAYAAFLMALAMAASLARAQDGPAGASVVIGLAGNLVAGAWNPIEVTVRDAAPSELEIRIDEGTLLTGPRIVRYRAAVPGGSGVTVFDDDVYVPPFQTLSWTLDTSDRVLASGALGARDADTRPLQLVVSSDPGAWRAAYPPGARFVDVAASQLPVRAAAYDGVRSLLLDGTAAAPRTESVAAAAAGGAEVLLAGALPASQAELGRLAGGGAGRLGAGEVRRVAPRVEAVRSALATWQPTDRDALVAALAAEPLVRPPRSADQPLVLALAATFALLVLLTLRFGGTPGVLAALALALVVSVAGWRLLRPDAPVLSAERRVMLGGGELALALGVREELTLPAGEVGTATAARPLSAVPYRTDGRGTHVALARWHGVSLALRPTLAVSSLRLHDGSIRNDGAVELRHVMVVGLGDQGSLAAGASRPVARGEEGAAPSELVRLAARLPTGSALAESGGTVWVALPPDAGQGGAAP